MKSSHQLSLSAAAIVAVLAPTLAAADVPPVDPNGRPAVIVCNIVGGQPLFAAHADKIIFKLTGNLQAANANDQAALNAVPVNAELDIKVLDDPRTVADLRAKVLTFLGAAVNAANRQQVRIIDVDYAMVCPLVPQPD